MINLLESIIVGALIANIGLFYLFYRVLIDKDSDD